MSKPSSDHTKPSDPSQTDGHSLEETKRRMIWKAKRGNWLSFMEDYEKIPQLRQALTQSKQTALHIVIAEGKDKYAMRLLEQLHQKDAAGHQVKVGQELHQKDERGDTALHLAAARGMTKVCRFIVEISFQLIFYSNKEGETPIFLACYHGWEDTFRFLRKKASSLGEVGVDDDSGDYHTRKDGNSLLHCAILNNKFDAALRILGLFPKLRTSCNKNGDTPLHILATKSIAFKSGTPLRIIDGLFYSWISVENTSYHENDAENSEEEHKGKMKEDHIIDLQESGMEEEDKKGYFCCWKNLKNMKQRHMVVEKIMVELLKVDTWYSYDFNKEDLGIPCNEERSNIFYSSVSDKMAEESTKTLENKEIPETMVKGSAGTLKINERSDTKIKDGESDAKIKKDGESDAKIKKDGESGTKIEKEFGETPFLIAAKMGVIEMVEAILEKFPCAIDDRREFDGKTALLLAVENRQIKVYDFLIKFIDGWNIEDKKRNNLLHLAANCSDHQPWRMPGESMKLLWEFNWYQHVRDSLPPNFTEARNADGKTPSEVFADTHKDQMRIVEGGRKWMNMTAQSCSVVSSLIAGVAFPSATTIPGDINDKGLPKFQGKYAFEIFMISSMVALYSSLVSLVLFLAVFITPYQDTRGFDKTLLKKLVIGIFFLFLSIVTILISFFSGHSLFLWGEKCSVPQFAFSIIILYLPFVLLIIPLFPFLPFLHLILSGRSPTPWYRDNCL